VTVISKTEYQEHFAKFNVLQCAVRNRNMFYFGVTEDYTRREGWRDGDDAPGEGDKGLERRLVSFMRSETEGRRWTKSVFTGFDGMLLAIANQPIQQAVIEGYGGAVFSIGSGSAGMEPPIRIPAAVVRLRTIGEHVYAAGTSRYVLRRDSPGKWKDLSRIIPRGKSTGDSVGFSDIAGFTEKDVYAVGGAGDIWCFNGVDWAKCNLPTNVALETVCCGADGNVYVSGSLAITFVGNRNRWKLVAEPNLSIPFKDMVWYDDRVWCTNDYGVWWIKDGVLSVADIPGSTRLCSGSLSVCDGVLLLAGHGGAAFLENGQWQVIFIAGEIEAK
jgi:hypothetical protein